MKRQALKVPQNKQIFFSSSVDKIDSLLEENKIIFSKYSFTILNQLFMKMRENSQKEVVRRALGFSKKIKETLSPIEKRKISEEIKAINNFVGEKIIPLKVELNKQIEREEEKMKQAKAYAFREFPYCLFSAKTLRNLLHF